ncbi:WbqC family protein [Sediminibacterium soli]|uniref:WbqC family protein n=1 Tax=Sediminibacterium soli TaxID=2698829 RepID=UPI001F40E6A3|nr:WbqC family protein [Sediminibacterium soli]NCI46340.1 WbqC family protein [Sediminibacterium soli]
MSSVLIDSQFFGTINYINTLFQYSNIIIESCESFRKMSFRNRCLIVGSNGLIGLSLPLVQGRDHRQLMKDVRINYQGRWQAEQLRTLDSCYARSPYYEYYRDEVRSLWEQKHPLLLEKNGAALQWLARVFSWKGRIGYTEKYQAVYDPAEVTDMRNRILPKNYRQWPAPRYTQVFEERTGFAPNLCILDLLFCNGPTLNTI